MPTLFRTSRLTLSAYHEGEVEEYFTHLYSDPEVVRYIGSGLFTRVDAVRDRIGWRIECEREHGFSFWTVRVTATGEFVGCCGLQPIERTGPEIEIGYHTAQRFWRNGYTSEAALACLQRAFTVHGLERVIAVCEPENVGSWKVMERIGMRKIGRTEAYYDTETLLYDALRATWTSPAGRGTP